MNELVDAVPWKRNVIWWLWLICVFLMRCGWFHPEYPLTVQWHQVFVLKLGLTFPATKVYGEIVFYHNFVAFDKAHARQESLKATLLVQNCCGHSRQTRALTSVFPTPIFLIAHTG